MNILPSLHPIDVENLAVGRITSHAMFVALKELMRCGVPVPHPSSATSAVIPAGCMELADVLNDAIQAAPKFIEETDAHLSSR